MPGIRASVVTSFHVIDDANFNGFAAAVFDSHY